VVADARSGALYFARYARLADGLSVLEPPQALAPGELARRIAGDFPLLGDAGLLRGDLLPPGAALRLRPAAPRALALARLGAARLARHGPSAPEEIEPLYLRPFAVRARA
jgi:hypothetical protein